MGKVTRLVCDDELQHKPGIYAIWSPDKKSAYIGASKDVHARYVQHRRNLHTHRHSCRKLQELYDKGGTFTFRLIEYCDLARLADREAAGVAKCATHRVALINDTGTPGAGLRGIKLETVHQLGNYMTPDLASQMLGVARDQVRKLVRDKVLRAVIFGGAIAIEQESVYKRLETHPSGEEHRGAGHRKKMARIQGTNIALE